MSKIRLFLNLPKIIIKESFKINGKDFLYLTKVMRQKINDSIIVFNGIDGEFIANITKINKKDLDINIIKKTRNLTKNPRISLAFAPVKNVRIDFVASKSCEMGVTDFLPIITQRTIVKRINQERFKANIKEAIEQCNRIDIAILHQIQTLSDFIKNTKESDLLILCDERILEPKIVNIFNKNPKYQNITLIIGPEGGFSEQEFKMMLNIKNLYNVTLGPRILRADTAIIAALALVNDNI
ncbi:MAG: 16S rRNA (uracil(1498)-N(3))-methyltransferase [Rickettsiales bacterium]|jgi:16S rRNA (uracil1498-N3)-methyltransferase|nr:16S rRNA (uracil(1498)-N(3))-methyltransferase [Rickettsiales bacterium]|tara:strand:+ start:3613 stop:4332 length:720 start_codon:yes stop_codon:yes gene_type:complete